MAFNFLDDKLAQQRANHLYRQRICLTTDNNHIKIDDRTYLNFSSNDYLGIAADKSLFKFLRQAEEKHHICASASNLVTGYHSCHQMLEEKIAQWLNVESVLLYNSGFSANVAICSALDSKDTHFILDKLSHASLIESSSTTSGKFSRFKHNDTQHLAQQLENTTKINKLVVTESIFSMDGDSALIESIETLCQKNDAWLLLDDAHGIGVLGENGAGASQCIKDKNATIFMGTFGKALATSGAFIASNKKLNEYLINFSKHYIYSTSISPLIAWLTSKSIDIAIAENWRREKLTELTTVFKSLLNDECVLTSSDSSIIGIIIGDEQKTIKVSKYLKENGFWVTAIRPPTVPKGTSRLRVTINSAHNHNQINALASCINKAVLACQN